MSTCVAERSSEGRAGADRPGNDRAVLRALGEELAEIAALPRQREKAGLWRRLNRLDAVRPMVYIYQIPWSEIEAVDPEPLRPRCRDEFLRSVEVEMRRRIYQWRNFPGDMVVEPVLFILPVLRGHDFGIQADATRLEQANEDLAIGRAIRSYHYHVQIRNEADIEKIRMPEIVHDADATRERVQALRDILGGVLQVEAGIGFRPLSVAPWDKLVQWTGVQEILTDLALRPAYVHALIDRLARAYEARLDQYESLGLLRLNNGPEVVGEGGLGCTDELPGDDYRPGCVKYHNLWGGGMAQIFSEVSPDMHREFALQYEARCLRRFPMVYYGCCEPLHHKVELVREMLPNIRKISMSPMADDARGAEAVGDTLVYSSKPNPANVATTTWRPGLVRRELSRILELTAGRGCHVELILKDISTIRSEPRRLTEWTAIALDLAEQYAN